MAYKQGSPLGVSQGGTGVQTANMYGVVTGQGSSAMNCIGAGTNGQVLIGATSANPAFASVTSTLGSIALTAGANSLNMDIVNFASDVSFTPQLAFGGSSTGVTYTTQVGLYSRVGSIVFFSINLTLSSAGSGSGNATITGLPFSANPSCVFAPNISFSGLTFTGVPTCTISNSTIIQLGTYITLGLFSNLTKVAFGVGTSIYVSGVYLV